MKQHYIKCSVNGHYEDLKTLFIEIKKEFNTESIHKFRVTYKKFRAFLRMLSRDSKAGKIKIHKKLESIYHLLGSVRDLQLQRIRVLKASKYEREKPRLYRIVLQKEIRKKKRKLAKINLNNKFVKSIKHRRADIPNKFPYRSFKKYAELKWAEICAIVLSENFSDPMLHLIRKHLKDLFYNMKEYEKATNKKLSKSFLKEKDESYLTQLLEELGNFHDKCTAIGLLKDKWTDGLNKQHMLRIEQSWLAEKSGMKDLLIARLKLLPMGLPANDLNQSLSVKNIPPV